jgi:Mg-chelatase subunit ChlI
LRPQLLDRFGLSVEIHGIRFFTRTVEIMQRHLAFEQNAERLEMNG